MAVANCELVFILSGLIWVLFLIRGVSVKHLSFIVNRTKDPGEEPDRKPSLDPMETQQNFSGRKNRCRRASIFVPRSLARLTTRTIEIRILRRSSYRSSRRCPTITG